MLFSASSRLRTMARSSSAFIRSICGTTHRASCGTCAALAHAGRAAPVSPPPVRRGPSRGEVPELVGVGSRLAGDRGRLLECRRSEHLDLDAGQQAGDRQAGRRSWRRPASCPSSSGSRPRPVLEVRLAEEARAPRPGLGRLAGASSRRRLREDRRGDRVHVATAAPRAARARSRGRRTGTGRRRRVGVDIGVLGPRLDDELRLQAAMIRPARPVEAADVVRMPMGRHHACRACRRSPSGDLLRRSSAMPPGRCAAAWSSRNR